MNNNNANNNANNINNINSILLDIEQKIRNNQFSSKTELNNYILSLRKDSYINENLSNQKVLQFFQLYDSLHTNDKVDINTQNYKAVSLEDQNLIVSTNDGVVLKTDTANEEMIKEFKEIQNTLTSNSQDGLVNADIVFDNMRNNIKEELELLTLSEIIKRDDIDLEVMNKIKFFLSNQHINPYSFKVDPNEAIFYNIETNEVFEVIKNQQTGNYEIYKGGELQFTNNNQDNEYSNDGLEQDEQYDTYLDSEREQISYNSSKPKGKVRKPINPNINKTGIIRNSFILFVIGLSSIILSLLLLSIR